MIKYIVKRVVYLFITLFIITTATFYLMHTIPGDPLTVRVQKNLPEQIRVNFEKKYGLDKPLHEQYGLFLKNITQGDFGESITYPGVKIADRIFKTAPISGALGGTALVVGFVLGMTLGIIAALNRGKWPDYLVMFLAIIGIVLPSFVLATLLQYVFANKLNVLPVFGWGTVAHAVLPVVALSFGTIATYARYMRSSVLEVINSDYILTARAKGVSEFNIIRKHVFKNAFIPSLTILGPQIGGIFAGSFVIEKIFSIPGLGFFLVSSINDRDYPMIISSTIFFAFLFIVATLVVDVLYVFIDPRIKLSED